MPLEDILIFIEMRIKEFNLNQTNINGYLYYRELYNTNPSYHTPLDLFVLTRYSFSNLLRFNKQNLFNASFGLNRGGYNINQKNNLIAVYPKILQVNLQCINFSLVDLSKYDFIYADPPYFNSGAVYNTKGFGGQNWTKQNDITLLNQLSSQASKFALSNLIKHKGQENKLLIEWINDNNYHMHFIGSNYDSCIYTTCIPPEPTIEICVTNY